MIIGIVGPASMIADAEAWLGACRSIITNDGSQPFLYPHFPGFRVDLPFQCDLVSGDTWREPLQPRELDLALLEVNFPARISAVADLYLRAIAVLAEREPRPDVTLCCIPQPVIDFCTKRASGAQSERRKLTKAERRALEQVRAGQGFLFPELDPTLSLEDADWRHENLRRAIKARAMQFGVPTQLVWPQTLGLSGAPSRPGEARTQDAATRAWNFMTALYHKAGGSPWRLAEREAGVCYVGISFYREILEVDPRLRTSMAQIFTSAGDGFVIRGNAFEWNPQKQRSPHLDAASAAGLMRSVLDMYKRQTQGSLPRRLVVQKSSRYWDEELSGFQKGAADVPRTDFVALGRRGIQFYRPGEYPALRGTYVKFSDSDLLLYTMGYIPYLRTYPGPRVPQPLEILEHYGSSPWDLVLRDVLSLTKLNWNSADFACAEPITLAFSRKVGAILAELPSGMPMRPEYRFYM